MRGHARPGVFFFTREAGQSLVNLQGKQVLDKDVSELLLSDLETKMLEVLQEAKKIMRHSKRHVLTT